MNRIMIRVDPDGWWVVYLPAGFLRRDERGPWSCSHRTFQGAVSCVSNRIADLQAERSLR